MKLLVCTQKVDKEDPVLGFFHQWLEKLAGRFESIAVICLQEGVHSLPGNVTVYSLGKGSGVSRWGYVVRFIRYIVRFRNDHGAVFVHMNQEYVLLGGLFWRLLGKKILFWRNHVMGSYLTRLAVFFSDSVLYTSPQSYTARFKKALPMPVGVDMEQFSRDEHIEREPQSVLSLGRISPIKNIHVFIDALSILDERGARFTATICGDAPEVDRKYLEKLKAQGKHLVEKDVLEFRQGVSHEKVPKTFNEHSIFVNLTESGSFDKTIIEAMASEMVVLTCNRSVEDILGKAALFDERDPQSVADSLQHALSLSKEEQVKEGRCLRMYAEMTHSLKELAERLAGEIEPPKK